MTDLSMTTVEAGTDYVIERDKSLALSVQSCMKTVGISLLSEWDVFVFVFRHGISLTRADQLARLIGYESAVVGGALHRLEREKLIERSRSSQGVCFYRIPVRMEAERWHCLRQLVSLSESRAGRLLVARLLMPVRPNQGERSNRLSLKSDAKCYV
jgi:DNA-binding MarR family transcriptional regulator